MTHAEFVELVERMRHAQKEYFRTKGNIRECKALESKVDKACREFRDGQGRLFEDELTPQDVKRMPLSEFERRFGFRPRDALEKCAWAMQGQLMDDTAVSAMVAGIIPKPDLSDVVMDEHGEK